MTNKYNKQGSILDRPKVCNSPPKDQPPDQTPFHTLQAWLVPTHQSLPIDVVLYVLIIDRGRGLGTAVPFDTFEDAGFVDHPASQPNGTTTGYQWTIIFAIGPTLDCAVTAHWEDGTTSTVTVTLTIDPP